MGEHLYLAHHGIKGMKWGVRRYRNPDGSLTDAGRKRYGVDSGNPSKRQMKRNIKETRRSYRKQTGDWMTTGKHVANVDKMVSKELGANPRRKELSEAREGLSKKIGDYEDKIESASNRINSIDESLADDSVSRSEIGGLQIERIMNDLSRSHYQSMLDAANKKYDSLTEEYESIGREAANRRLNSYKRAVVADLGYEDIAAGVKLLEDYGLTNYALRWDMYRSAGA